MAGPRFEPLECRSLLTAGALDPTFDFDGIALTDFGYADPAVSEEIGYAGAVQADGKVLVGGYWAAGGNQNAAIARFLANGEIDSGFGVAGMVRFTDEGTSASPFVSIAVQPDGKILAARNVGASGTRDFGLVRMNQDGSLDTSFSGDGKASVSLSANDDILHAMVLQADGRIVLGGYTDVAGSDMAMVRFNADGYQDSAFGLRTVDFGGSDRLYALAEQPNGRILAVGFTETASTLHEDVAIARLNADGTLDDGGAADTTPGDHFGVSGLGFTWGDLSGNRNDRGWSVAVDSQDRIVVGARSWNGGNWDFSVMRMLVDGSDDVTFDGDGKRMFDIPHAGGENDYVNQVVVDSSDRPLLIGFTDSGSRNVSMARFTTSGAPDTTFGGGTASINFDIAGSSDYAIWGSVLPDGRIVAAGGTMSGGANDFLALRLLSSGAADTSYSGDGVARAERPLSLEDRAEDVVIQPDGKVVIGGYGWNGANNDAVVVRYNLDGSLDTSFGGDGIVSFGVGTGNDQVSAVALQPDGKIVVTGDFTNGSTADHFVARINPDGSLDAAFDGDGGSGNGIVTHTLGASHDIPFALALQPDGKIVTGGRTGPVGSIDFQVVRLRANGQLDTTFDGDGRAAIDFASGNDVAEALALQPDGRILVGGRVTIGGSIDMGLARLNSNGTLDASFDGDGRRSEALGSAEDEIQGLALMPDGRIVAAGSSRVGSNYHVALVRYTVAGSLDTTFFSDGVEVTTSIAPYTVGRGVALQADGKIVVAGQANDGVSDDVLLVRYQDDGSLDTSFSSDGSVISPIGAGQEFATSLAIQPDGKIVLAGFSYRPEGNYGLLAMRFEGDARPATVASATPDLSGGVVSAGTSALSIEFSETMIGAGTAPNYELRSLGPDALLGTADDTIHALSASYDATTAVTTLSFAPLAESVYRLTVRDAIVDSMGLALDGNDDGAAGGDWTRDFVVNPVQTSVTEVISHADPALISAGLSTDSYQPSISADGRYVAFYSFAGNLVAGDTNGRLDVFVRDLVSGTTTLASTGIGGIGNSDSYEPSISADGRYVAFHSYADNLVAGDTNSQSDVFVRDLVAGTTTLVSTGASGIGNSGSLQPSISGDGRYVAFYSYASNLVDDDTNGRPDVFVRDLVAGTTTLLSTGATGIGSSDSLQPSISADGRYVAFGSYVSNFVAGDYNGTADVYLSDFAATGILLYAASGVGIEIDRAEYGAGQLIHRPRNSFDGLNRLQVGSQDYAPAIDAVTDDSLHTVVTATQALAGLNVHREITVPNAGNEDVARTVDIFENATGSDITVPVRIVGNLGSDAATTVFATSDGDTDLEVTDQWIGTDDADGTDTPAIIHYVHGPAGIVPTSVVRTGDKASGGGEFTCREVVWVGR